MCNLTSIFDILGEELKGEHDNELISLPNNCSLKLWPDFGGIRWFYETTNTIGKKATGCCVTRSDAFDKAIEELAIFIN